MPLENDNVGLAFLLVIGAGLSTALGAAVVFFPSLVQYATRKTLAGALGLSAGVMVFVSFAEILTKSHLAFIDAGREESTALPLSQLCFFAGVILMVILNHIVHNLLKGGYQLTPRNTSNMKTDQCDSSVEGGVNNDEVAGIPPACACQGRDPAALLEEMKVMGKEIEAREAQEMGENAEEDVENAEEDVENEEEDVENEEETKSVSESEKKRLVLMSVNTAAAIALHNFPEGLATFVATLSDPTVGLVLAMAIAIHNIPEGLCVAMPVYYATGSRLKAFTWALLSGVSEPIAALFGWLILANRFTDTLYGVLFGIVAGMMVIISVRELLPTAHRYDPEDSVVTYMFIAGMIIMSLSLVLFVV